MVALMEKKRIQSEKKTPGYGVYLGKEDERAARLTNLKTLALQFGLSGPSELIQRIADGDLIVTLPPQRPKKSP